VYLAPQAQRKLRATWTTLAELILANQVLSQLLHAAQWATKATGDVSEPKPCWFLWRKLSGNFGLNGLNLGVKVLEEFHSGFWNSIQQLHDIHYHPLVGAHLIQDSGNHHRVRHDKPKV